MSFNIKLDSILEIIFKYFNFDVTCLYIFNTDKNTHLRK